mmetsp:Transcript_30001/g.36568  ORF Transcript_30001/g.36568 Transcript_30001/m.36568 type:complete len:245 (+) Transcript_30001:101-835(+)
MLNIGVKRNQAAVVSDDERGTDCMVSNKRSRLSSSQNFYLRKKKRVVWPQDASKKWHEKENEAPQCIPTLSSFPRSAANESPSTMLQGIYFDNCELSSFLPDPSVLMDPSFILGHRILRQRKCFFKKQQHIARPLEFPLGYFRQVASRQQRPQVNIKERPQYPSITHIIHKPKQLDSARITKDNCVPDIEKEKMDEETKEDNEKIVTSSLMDAAIILTAQLPHSGELVNVDRTAKQQQPPHVDS